MIFNSKREILYLGTKESHRIIEKTAEEEEKV
jgi:hypothetical protein